MPSRPAIPAPPVHTPHPWRPWYGSTDRSPFIGQLQTTLSASPDPAGLQAASPPPPSPGWVCPNHDGQAGTTAAAQASCSGISEAHRQPPRAHEKCAARFHGLRIGWICGGLYRTMAGSRTTARPSLFLIASVPANVPVSRRDTRPWRGHARPCRAGRRPRSHSRRADHPDPTSTTPSSAPAADPALRAEHANNREAPPTPRPRKNLGRLAAVLGSVQRPLVPLRD